MFHATGGLKHGLEGLRTGEKTLLPDSSFGASLQQGKEMLRRHSLASAGLRMRRLDAGLSH